jgi:hypothetical protein
MATKWRAILAACVLGSAFLLVFVWLPSTRGHLEGTVHFVGCGGAEPRPQPGQAPAPNCSSMLVPGAVVVAIPGTAARFDRYQAGRFIVVPSPSGSISARSDGRGKYRLDLAPGNYMIGASESGWRLDEGGGIYSQVPPAVSEFRQIPVVGGATISLDIVILFNAA